MEKILELYLKSQTSMIWCSSQEEDRSVLRIQAVAENLGYAVFVWTCTDDFVQRSKGSFRQPGDGCSTNVDQALTAIAGYKHTRAVFVLKDFQLLIERIERSPEYVSLVRRLKGLYSTLKANGAVVMFMASSPVIATELKDCLTLLETSLPGPEERLSILQAWIQVNGRSIPCNLDEERCHRIVSVSAGLSSRGLQSALAISAVKRGELGPGSVDDVLTEKVSVVKSTEVLRVIQVDQTIEDVGGLDGLKDFFIKRAQAFSKAAERYGLPKPKGILLCGPPGTGKSLTSKAAASMLHMPLLGLDIGRLQGSLVGQSEERLRHALALAETQAPCLLQVDEVEKAFGGVGGPSGDGGVLQRQFGYMLEWMQEHDAHVFVLATCNNIRRLPPEFLRKGRFDEIFFVDLPTPPERKAIMTVLLRKYGQNPKGLVTDVLVDKLEGYAGAEIEYVIVEAMYEAFFDHQRRLRTEDLEKAMARIIPVSDQMKDEIQELRRWGKANARPAS